MGIQYGTASVSDIKYCNPQGVLQNVDRVVRNGSAIWSVNRKTCDRGVWRGAGDVLRWSDSRHKFMSVSGGGVYIEYVDGGPYSSKYKWYDGDVYYARGVNEYSTVIYFEIGGGSDIPFYWSAE